MKQQYHSMRMSLMNLVLWLSRNLASEQSEQLVGDKRHPFINFPPNKAKNDRRNYQSFHRTDQGHPLLEHLG